ncbi:Uncharacterised protein [Mycobacteroides abscessus subsp. abscessus]|nr:Uncharacterised protein [Mycobacteroides abscessus subsp. abscessus]SHP67571.1 Uncharacterised protein [Mycobacteroides abscessus subsp. abscessus]SHY38818.1 Uncharacterised protein [Mycobacteroides abscessus subsp. abscessus]SKD94553.1 Uncharacterised protein [Mycobacteroides abscessus subsp. abscessus]
MTAEFNYIDVEDAWAERRLPRVFESGVIVSAWMTDAEIAEQAAALASVYGNEYEVDTAIRLFRAQLRSAALATAASPLTSEAATIVGNMTHLITHATTDSELAAYADAAESGAGGPVDGLYEELVQLRDAERDDRVFVAGAGAGAPRVENLDASE